MKFEKTITSMCTNSDLRQMPLSMIVKQSNSRYSTFLIGLLFMAGLLGSCKESSLFPGDSRTYGKQADSVRAYSGSNRLKINIAIPNSDVVSAKVYWNDRKNAVDVPIHLTAWPDTVSTIIGPLDEGDYSFEVITYDNKGNASIPIKVAGTALGSKYAHSLANRAVRDIYYDNGVATINWGDAVGEQSTEVSYTDKNNALRKVIVPFGKDTTQLVDFKPGTLSATISYKTIYLPKLAIDKFAADDKTETVITGTLRDIVNSKKLYFGSLISYGGGETHGAIFDGSPNGIYTKTCLEQFNVGQATWGPGRWKREGGSDFNDVNAVINWSRPRYDKVMAMLIVGPNNYMPAWFTSGTFTPAEMDVMLKNLITELMTSNDNKSKVDVWNVANELFNEDGTYRNMKWNDMGWEDDASGLKGTDKINLKHPVFVGKAFQYCRELTNALLELRDYGIENNDPKNPSIYKYKAFYQLLKHLKATNRPVDVVGIQSHIMIGKGTAVGTSVNMNGDVPAQGYEGFANAIKTYKAMNLSVYLTELDIVSLVKNSTPLPFTPAMAEQQKKDYYLFVKTAVDAGVNLVSLWGARDNNSTGWRYNQNPLLLDANYNKKPAYFGLQKAFFEAK